MKLTRRKSNGVYMVRYTDEHGALRRGGAHERPLLGIAIPAASEDRDHLSTAPGPVFDDPFQSQQNPFQGIVGMRIVNDDVKAFCIPHFFKSS